MVTRAGRLAAAVLRAEQLDKDWMRRPLQGLEERRLYLAWMPFPVPAFLALLGEALAGMARMTAGPVEDLDPQFLEIGCGPGSKLLLARDWAGLDAHGIERCDEMAAAARSLGLDAETADADGWKGYGNYDLIWFNRPFRDPASQLILEEQVWEDMKPGAVVMCANLEYPPSSWFPVLDDWEARRGIWMKPVLPAG